MTTTSKRRTFDYLSYTVQSGISDFYTLALFCACVNLCSVTMSSTGSWSLLWLALFVVGDARIMSLVLVKEAVNEVVSSVSTLLHAQSYYRLQGAVCLDGSAPGYYIGEGSGSGARKWILHQGGGGWCNSIVNCLERSKTSLGSSSLWRSYEEIGGIFSDNATVNGEFHNWNVVYLGYCDGASFSGYR